MRFKLALVSVVLIALAGALSVASYVGAGSLSVVSLVARWAAIAGLLGYAAVRRSLTTSILVGMLVGAEVGHDFPSLGRDLRVLSQIFLRLVKTIVAPLLFGTLVVGIAGHADLKKVGRMGIKALVYFEIVTTIALFIGLAAINLVKAGVGIHLPTATHTEEIPAAKGGLSEVLLHIFPENIAQSVAEGQILQVVVFSVLFAIGLALVSEPKRQPMLRLAESLAETMFKFTHVVMRFAPIGVGAAIAYTVAHQGLSVLVHLFKLLATFYGALFAFVVLVLLPVALIAKVPIRKFARAIAEPVSIAFATTSSEAALPRAMEALEGLGIPRQVVAFVMPTGYSFNLDGSAVYLSLASVFVAQAAGVTLSLWQQLLMVFTLMLSSKGVAGVPRASLVILLGTVGTFHLPAEPVFIMLGIDGLMDMGRTSLNVIGNCLATVVVARWEREFPGHAST